MQGKCDYFTTSRLHSRHDSRMLQMTRVGNLRLPEVVTTADEVDSQAKQAMITTSMSCEAGAKRGKDDEDEVMEGDRQHGQTSRPRVWPREESGSKADAHQRQRFYSLAVGREPY